MAHYPARSPPPLLVLAVSPSTINGWRRLFLSGTPRPLSSVAIKSAYTSSPSFPLCLCLPYSCSARRHCAMLYFCPTAVVVFEQRRSPFILATRRAELSFLPCSLPAAARAFSSRPRALLAVVAHTAARRCRATPKFASHLAECAPCCSARASSLTVDVVRSQFAGVCPIHRSRDFAASCASALQRLFAAISSEFLLHTHRRSTRIVRRFDLAGDLPVISTVDFSFARPGVDHLLPELRPCTASVETTETGGRRNAIFRNLPSSLHL